MKKIITIYLLPTGKVSLNLNPWETHLFLETLARNQMKECHGALRTRKGENEVQLERNEEEKELNSVKEAVIQKYIQSIFPEEKNPLQKWLKL